MKNTTCKYSRYLQSSHKPFKSWLRDQFLLSSNVALVKSSHYVCINCYKPYYKMSEKQKKITKDEWKWNPSSSLSFYKNYSLKNTSITNRFNPTARSMTDFWQHFIKFRKESFLSVTCTFFILYCAYLLQKAAYLQSPG